MIAVDPSDNTSDVLDDTVFVPVSVCTPDVDAGLGWCSNSPDVVTEAGENFSGVCRLDFPPIHPTTV